MRGIVIALLGVVLAGAATPPVAPDGTRAALTAAGSSPQAAGAKPLAGVVIVVDPGHQLGNHNFPRRINRLVPFGAGRKPCDTTGTATNGGYPEATFTWQVANLVRRRLVALGARVVMTRTTNSQQQWGPCVDVRGRRGNAIPADLKVSIHGDGSYAAGARGFHVIYASDLPPTRDTFARSRRYARATRGALDRAGFHRSTYIGGGTGLDVRHDLGTLDLSQMPACLVELGNMRNPRDARLMTSARGRARYARALVAGMRAFLKR